MGILTSLISLGIVVGLGYYTIKYIIPKIEDGSLDLGLGLGALMPPAAATTDTPSTIAAATDDVSTILGNLAQDVGLPTTDGEIAPDVDIKLPTLPPAGTKVASLGGKKKGKGEFLSSDLAGADNRKAGGGAKSGGSRKKSRGGGGSGSKKKGGSGSSSSSSSSSKKKGGRSKDEDEEEEEVASEVETEEEEEEEDVEEIEKETIYFYYNNVWDY